MRESKGDMFEKKPSSAIVISTNGYRKANGQAVLGRGCAQKAAQMYPELPKLLGEQLRQHQNRVHHFIMKGDKNLVTFPVKPAFDYCDGDKRNVVKHMQKRFKPGDLIPGWACVAEPELIIHSATELVKLTNFNGWEDVICPRFGCGAGELDWDDMKPMLDPILDDRFIVMTF